MIQTKNHKGVYYPLLLCGIVITLGGCEQPPSPKRTVETLIFNVDQTRLEPAITDTLLKIEIAAPKGWKAIDAAMLSQVIDRLGDTLTQGLQMEPRWVFVSEGSQAMCVVSRLPGVKTAPDETLLQTLETAYRTQFPKATVQRSTFIKDTFHVSQLMVGAADFVLIKLVFAGFDGPSPTDAQPVENASATENPVFEVDYVVPIAVYETELRAIESSIGSITYSP